MKAGNKSWKKYATIVFLSIFFLNFIQIFQGLDLTDEGIFLINGNTAFPIPKNHDEVYGAATMFLTLYIGGAWNSMGAPSLLFARLGGAVFLSFAALLAYLCLIHFFDEKKTMFTVIATSVYLSSFSPKVLSYLNIPAFFIVLFLFVFTKGLFAKKEHAPFILALSGFILAACSVLMVNLITLLVAIPVLLLIFEKKVGVKKLASSNALKYVLIGVGVGLASYLILLVSTGYLEAYITQVLNTVFKGFLKNNPNYFYGHELSRTIWTLKMDLTKSIAAIIIFAVAIAAVHFINKNYPRSFVSSLTKKNLIYLVCAVPVFYFIFVLVNPLWARDFMWSGVETLLLLCGLIVLWISFNLRNKASMAEKELLLLLWLATAFAFIIPTPSDDGLWRAHTGIWLLLPASLLSLSKIKAEKNSFQEYLAFLGKYVPIFLLLIGLAFASLVIAAARDHPRYALNTPFQYEPLRGVYSQADKVNELETMFSIIENNTEKGDSILLASDMPLVHYLTETRPVYGEGWVMLDPYEQVVLFEKAIEAKGTMPKLTILVKYPTPEFYWPVVKRTFDPNRQKIYDFIDEKYTARGFGVIYENENFKIFQNKSAKTQ